MSRDLLPLDLEIEATFRARQRHACTVNREAIQDREGIMDPETTPLRDFAMSNPNSMPSSIMRPPHRDEQFSI